MTEYDNNPADDMSEFLQAYLDETDEELETLVEALLRLEEDPRERDALDEAFRMMHSLKGSSGMMGYEGIADLAHHLETQFDHIRSGTSSLSRPTMDLMLECVDFFRAFATNLRNGDETNQNASALIGRLVSVEQEQTQQSEPPSPTPEASETGGITPSGAGYRVRVTFQKGLQLADLKAKLIIARLSNVGEIIGSEPPIEELQSFDELPQFVVIVATDRGPSEVTKIADVDGVESVTLETSDDSRGVGQQSTDTNETLLLETDGNTWAESLKQSPAAQNAKEPADDSDSQPDKPSPEQLPIAYEHEEDTVSEANPAPMTAANVATPRVTETVRVDVDRLDRLMNLTGELVVTSAQFNQISTRISPALRGQRRSNQMSDVIDRLRVGLLQVRKSDKTERNESSHLLNEMDRELESLREQSELWDESRQQFTQISEAVDKLMRVSQNLQKGVLDTRMVPVGPLFGRYKRVVRDIAVERGLTVDLIIRGENTELDKRMIDELGDPLLHLIRNSVDHGLESPDSRQSAGKPRTGRIVLEAFHSGNNVLIAVEDDGAGINIQKVRDRIVEKGLADRQLADSMPDQKVIDHIWYPGFSTTQHVTEISGRGVGMDIVRSRINELNGSIEISTESGRGTKFLLRLPLTLAIIRGLMIRFRDGFFSIPMDNVREIVSVPIDQVYSVHGNESIEVRGEFVPITSMTKVFKWSDSEPHRPRIVHTTESRTSETSVGEGNPEARTPNSEQNASGKGEVVDRKVAVVILQSRGKTLGLSVDELLGGADIVIKSLTDNFVGIRGLSGASVMGDGTVSLMLDIDVLMEMAQTD